MSKQDAEYYRNWHKKNKEKSIAAQERYWMKRLKKKLMEEIENEKNQKRDN